MTRTLRVASGMVATGVLALVFTSCGGSHDDVQRAVVPTTPEMTAPVMTSIEATDATTSEEVTPLSDEEAIVAAVNGYWRVILEASSPPNPNHPGLMDHMDSDVRARTIEIIEEDRANGLAVRLPESASYSHNPQIQSIESTHAEVIDCAVDDSILYNSNTGEIINDAIETDLWHVELAKIDDRWKVTLLYIVNKYQGVSNCG